MNGMTEKIIPPAFYVETKKKDTKQQLLFFVAADLEVIISNSCQLSAAHT